MVVGRDAPPSPQKAALRPFQTRGRVSASDCASRIFPTRHFERQISLTRLIKASTSATGPSSFDEQQARHSSDSSRGTAAFRGPGSRGFVHHFSMAAGNISGGNDTAHRRGLLRLWREKKRASNVRMHSGRFTIRKK